MRGHGDLECRHRQTGGHADRKECKYIDRYTLYVPFVQQYEDSMHITHTISHVKKSNN